MRWMRVSTLRGARGEWGIHGSGMERDEDEDENGRVGMGIG